jgi:hypothetical protein
MLDISTLPPFSFALGHLDNPSSFSNQSTSLQLAFSSPDEEKKRWKVAVCNLEGEVETWWEKGMTVKEMEAWFKTASKKGLGLDFLKSSWTEGSIKVKAHDKKMKVSLSHRLI